MVGTLRAGNLDGTSRRIRSPAGGVEEVGFIYMLSKHLARASRAVPSPPKREFAEKMPNTFKAILFASSTRPITRAIGRTARRSRRDRAAATS